MIDRGAILVERVKKFRSFRIHNSIPWIFPRYQMVKSKYDQEILIPSTDTLTNTTSL